MSVGFISAYTLRCQMCTHKYVYVEKKLFYANTLYTQNTHSHLVSRYSVKLRHQSDAVFSSNQYAFQSLSVFLHLISYNSVILTTHCPLVDMDNHYPKINSPYRGDICRIYFIKSLPA